MISYSTSAGRSAPAPEALRNEWDRLAIAIDAAEANPAVRPQELVFLWRQLAGLSSRLA